MEHNGNMGNPRPKLSRQKTPKLSHETSQGTLRYKRMIYTDANGVQDVLILFLTSEVISGGKL